MSSDAYIYIYITCILIILGFFFRKNKIYFLVLLVWQLIIGGLNTYCVDWEGNESIFYAADIKGYSLFGLYNQLAVLCRNHGIDFVGFNFIVYFLTILLISYVILKFSTNPNMVMAYMMIFPFIDNIIQKRGYPVIGIMTLAFGLYYLSEDKRRGLLIFAILAYISFQFHSSGILFFSFVVYELIPKKFKFPVVFMYVIIATILRNNFSKIFQLLGNHELNSKSNLYFNKLAANSTISHFLFWILWQCLFLLLIYLIKKHYPNKFNLFVWNINIWALTILPLYAFDPVFSRVFRVVIIFNYISISNALIIFGKKILTFGLKINALQLALSAFSMYLFDIGSASLGFNEMVLWIYQNNLLIK